ncbi:MAG: hypothetical protein AAGF47_11720 [Planctomycetota bacterium]
MSTTNRAHHARAAAGLLVLAAACASAAGCYSRVVDSKGLGADSVELRKAAEDDAKPRQTIRRNLFPDQSN